MAISLDRVRLSLIWTQSYFDLLADGGPADAPMGFLGRESSYATRFAALPLPGTNGGDLTVPWPGPAGQYFWTYYLEGNRPGDLTGSQAWKQCVPFRAPVPARMSRAGSTRKVLLEAFYYPYGVALVATLTVEEPLDFEAAVDNVFDLRRTAVFDVQWDQKTGRAAESLTLAQMADASLPTLRSAALGKNVAPAAQSVEPFSVLTVIGAKGVAPGAPIVEGSAVHRALEAMASWRPGWKIDILPALKDSTVDTRAGAAGVDVLYARPRGRVVWFCRLLAGAEKEVAKKKGNHALACYHRNLTFLSLQVEAMGTFARATAATLDVAGTLPAAHLECAKRSAGVLGRLYGGKKDVYRSWSPRKQIDQNALVDPINKVRDVFGMKPLS